jgi:hypothetical protein
MAFAPAMNVEFIVGFFGNLSRETSIEVMKVSYCKHFTYLMTLQLFVGAAADGVLTEGLCGQG